MPIESPEQYELKVLRFYLAHIESDLERPERKKYYVAAYFFAALLCLILVMYFYTRTDLELGWLFGLSVIGGMSFTGGIITAQSKAHFKLLKRFIDSDGLRARINELQT